MPRPARELRCNVNLKQDARVFRSRSTLGTSCRRKAEAFAIVATTLVATTPAGAQPVHPVRDALRVGPSSCLDAATLASRVEMWLGRPEIDARVSVRVGDERDKGHGVVFTVLREGEPVAERRLRPRGIPCPDLTAAVGIAIALAVDATFLASLMNVADVESLKAPPEPPPKPVRAPASRPEPRQETVGVRASVQAVGLVGVLPAPVAGASFGFDAALASWADLRITGVGTAHRPVRIGTGEADVGLAAGRFDGCFVRPVDTVSLVGCGGFAAGRWMTSGTGYDVNQSPSLPWMAAVARLEGRLEVGEDKYVVLALDGFIPLLRPRLDVEDGSGRVVASAETPAAGLGVAVGPAIAFF